jgi:hypothetical protein
LPSIAGGCAPTLLNHVLPCSSLNLIKVLQCFESVQPCSAILLLVVSAGDWWSLDKHGQGRKNTTASELTDAGLCATCDSVKLLQDDGQ